ncbi:MAG: proton-conducting transporter membrane subunit, partial [Planctomycetota bacterium]
TAALAALGRTRVSPFAVALLGCFPATVLVRGVARLSIGAEALYTIGAGGALVAAIAAAGTRGWTLPGDRSAACARAAALVGGAHALLVGGLGASSEAAVDAAWVGLAASFGLSLAVAFAVVGLDRLGTSAPPGFAPRGLGRLHPTTSLLLAVAALALAGAPPLASFAARVRALGEVTQSGAGREAFLLVVVQAPLFAAAALGLLHRLLRTPPEAGEEAPGGRGTRSGGTSTGGGLPRGGLRDGLLRTALLGLAAGLALAFGLFPDAPFGAAPHGSDPRGATFPSGAGQLELLVGAAVVFGAGVLLRRDSTGA